MADIPQTPAQTAKESILHAALVAAVKGLDSEQGKQIVDAAIALGFHIANAAVDAAIPPIVGFVKPGIDLAFSAADKAVEALVNDALDKAARNLT